MTGAALAALCLAVLALTPHLPFWPAALVLHLAVVVMPFYVTLTAQLRDLVPPQRTGRAITSLYLFGLSGAFVAQWLTGALVGLTAGGDGIGSALGYRLAFGFVALLLLAALLVYRRAPERPPAAAQGSAGARGLRPQR